MGKLRTLFRTVVIETLVGVGITIGFLAVLVIGLIACAAVVMWIASPAPIPPLLVASPDGRAAVMKQYGPLDEAEYVELRVVVPWLIFHPSYHLATLQNPTGVTREDGATVSWDGNGRLILGWPAGGIPVRGPTRIGDIQISYREYDPVLSHVSSADVINLALHDVTATFQEQHVLERNSRYVATGRQVEHIQCAIKVSGFDGSLFGRVTVEVGGTAVGSGIGLKVYASRLAPDLAPSQTLTQAEFEGVFPQNDLTSAPGQEDGAVAYRLFTVNEAKQVFAAIKDGRVDLLLALNFGDKVLHYSGKVSINRTAIDSFNACSARARFYYTPFVVTAK